MTALIRGCKEVKVCCSWEQSTSFGENVDVSGIPLD